VIAEKDIKENMERVINTFIDINDEEDQKT
jgi:hypothetical protein